MKTIRQKIAVPFQYPVHFTHDVFNRANPLLAKALLRSGQGAARVLVVLDSGVAEAWPKLCAKIEGWFKVHKEQARLVCPPMIVPGGEQAKNSWESVRRIMALAAEHHLDRHAYIVAVGGGSVLDMSGFAASIIHRGVRIVRLPTTVLAQNDAGVGVKNSMNACNAKNFVGTFAPPNAVINDFTFLKSLPQREWTSGIAEAFKVAIIKDRALFDHLCAHAVDLRQRHQLVMERVVYETARLHLRHIATAGDPFEFGSARPLDFGHWAAHRLELLSGFQLGHGHAVAIGIALDSAYAMLKKMIAPSEFTAIIKGLSDCGAPVWSPLLERVEDSGKLAVLAGIEQFREHLGGRLCITLPRSIGASREVHVMSETVVVRAIATLKEARGENGA